MSTHFRGGKQSISMRTESKAPYVGFAYPSSETSDALRNTRKIITVVSKEWKEMLD
jgi:hypothetical protein